MFLVWEKFNCHSPNKLKKICPNLNNLSETLRKHRERESTRIRSLMNESHLRKRNIVNYSGGVETADGRILYGLDAETYLKVRTAHMLEVENF